MSAIRILLADDHVLVLAGIRALISEMEGTQIVAEATNGREAVALAKQHRPDLVVMDISMKELNGIEATAQIRAEVPGSRVLILSMHTTEDFVLRALKAGASGYLVKDSAPLDLQMAIAAVMRDEIYLSPRISKHVIAGFLKGNSAPDSSSLDVLTARQREILQMIAEGKSTKEIAYGLDLSVKTVETHRAALMERLDIHDVAGLVLYAVRKGLVSVDRNE
ncbi:MAG: response regulator transcription factor [Burkholderiales bacterium]|nr:response regulator transcription factor [Burkholderiales bacterium]